MHTILASLHEARRAPDLTESLRTIARDSILADAMRAALDLNIHWLESVESIDAIMGLNGEAPLGYVQPQISAMVPLAGGPWPETPTIVFLYDARTPKVEEQFRAMLATHPSAELTTRAAVAGEPAERPAYCYRNFPLTLVASNVY